MALNSNTTPESQTKRVIPFVTEVARYFMEFLETDFHKVRNPKRHIQYRNSNNLQVGVTLNKYKKFTSLAWKVIRSGFEDPSIQELNRGTFTTPIPPSLLQLVQAQISAITREETERLIKYFKAEIDLGLSKHSNDTTAAIAAALDGIARVIREKFLAVFVNRIKDPIETLKTTTVDSMYQI